MCESCRFEGSHSPETFADAFRFENETLNYYDGPLGGWLRCHRCEQLFAFDCEAILPDHLWHWSLVPVGDQSANPEDVIDSSSKTREGEWISVLEDSRTDTSRIDVRWLQNTRVRPPSPLLRAKIAGQQLRRRTRE